MMCLFGSGPHWEWSTGDIVFSLVIKVNPKEEVPSLVCTFHNTVISTPTHTGSLIICMCLIYFADDLGKTEHNISKLEKALRNCLSPSFYREGI